MTKKVISVGIVSCIIVSWYNFSAANLCPWRTTAAITEFYVSAFVHVNESIISKGITGVPCLDLKKYQKTNKTPRTGETTYASISTHLLLPFYWRMAQLLIQIHFVWNQPISQSWKLHSPLPIIFNASPHLEYMSIYIIHSVAKSDCLKFRQESMNLLTFR